MTASLRIDTTEWISGALVIGNTGGGVLAEDLAASGENGTGYLAATVSLPADAGKEICGRFTYVPPGLNLFAYEDGSLVTSAADGVYTALYQLYVDYVPVGVPTELTFRFGQGTMTMGWTEGTETGVVQMSSTVTTTAGWTEGGETINTALVASVLGVSGWIEGSETIVANLNITLELDGSLGWTEGSETFSLVTNATLEPAVVVSWTEGSETISAGAEVVLVPEAAAAWTEGSEASVLTLTLPPELQVGWVEGSETVVIAGLNSATTGRPTITAGGSLPLRNKPLVFVKSRR